MALIVQSHYQLGLLAAHLKEYRYEMFASMSYFITLIYICTISGEQQGGRVDSSSAQSSAHKGCSRGGEEGQVAFTPFDDNRRGRWIFTPFDLKDHLISFDTIFAQK